MEHFGVNLISRGKGFKLIRDKFALINTKPSIGVLPSLVKMNAYADESRTLYRQEWCSEYRELCLKNFDLNMKYFSMLDREEFNAALNSFIEQHNGFEEVHDLSRYSKVEGYYMMVLDEYKQVYIGKTEDIKKRIMQHWSNTKPFDRTLWPMYAYDTSCFSIDFFRALDTTRIFAWEQQLSDGIEEELVCDFPTMFCTNRTGGDITNAILAIATMNKRVF